MLVCCDVVQETRPETPGHGRTAATKYTFFWGSQAPAPGSISGVCLDRDGVTSFCVRPSADLRHEGWNRIGEGGLMRGPCRAGSLLYFQLKQQPVGSAG